MRAWRFLSITLAVMIALSAIAAVPFCATQSDAEDLTFETCIPGDANDDGVVDGRDVIRCKKIILGLEDATCGADANEDGTVDGRDVVRTKKAVLGIE